MARPAGRARFMLLAVVAESRNRAPQSPLCKRKSCGCYAAKASKASALCSCYLASHLRLPSRYATLATKTPSNTDPRGRREGELNVEIFRMACARGGAPGDTARARPAGRGGGLFPPPGPKCL